MSSSCSPLDGKHIWTSRDEGLDWWLLCHLAGLCRVIARWCDGQTESSWVRERKTKARLAKLDELDMGVLL